MMSRRSSKRRVLRFAGALSTCLAMSAGAQQVTGDIVGTVTDATGAVVPAAQITVENTGTHQVRYDRGLLFGTVHGQ